MVSQAAAKSGGYVHGIIPKALVSRGSECTAAPGSSEPSNAQSKEGAGEEILQEDSDRVTMETVGSMHDVSKYLILVLN